MQDAPPGIGHNRPPSDVGKVLPSLTKRLLGGVAAGALYALTPTPAGESFEWPTDKSRLGHIFRDVPGHYSKDTLEARIRINRAVTEGIFEGIDSVGNAWFSRINSDGSQTWVRTRKGLITNAGENTIPLNIQYRMP